MFAGLHGVMLEPAGSGCSSAIRQTASNHAGDDRTTALCNGVKLLVHVRAHSCCGFVGNVDAHSVCFFL
jgi:hypothetical protein